MPVYCYECKCGFQVEINHPYDELANGFSETTKSKLDSIKSEYSDCNKQCELTRVMAFPGLGTFDSSTAKVKKQMLRKRAQEHWAKDGKDQKHEIMKDTLSRMNKANGF